MTTQIPDPGGRPRTALLSSLGAAVSLIGGWFLAQSLQASDFNPVRESVSALAAGDMPFRWVMTSAFIITGLLHMVTAWCLPGAAKVGRILLAAGGAAMIAVALLPMPARGTGWLPHTIAAAVSFALLALWPLAAARPESRGLLQPTIARTASIVLLIGSATVAATITTGVFGAIQRIVLAALVLWPFATAAVAWVRAGWPIGSPRSKHILATAVFTLLTLLGGITATNLAPVTVQTDYYQATVSLSPDPRDGTNLTVPTIFGDITMNFQGVAPGIVATPQIRAEITDALAQPGMSASSLQPTSEEIGAVVTEAAWALGTRFVIGAVTVAALLLLAYLLVRHRRPRLWLFASTGTAALLATALTGAGVATTYQVDRQPTFATTGVLSAVQANLRILDDVETRSAQVAPYLRNLIQLSGALQEKYTDPATEQDIALRVLLVSDIHGANYYPLMRSIVEDEQIDVVVDTGDIVNFGSPAELGPPDLADGIASLGVPYLFVRGNHDARAELDYDLVDAIASIPNAIVLQPTPDSYTEVDLGGVTIAGFNDPRYFGDSGSGSAAKQQPAREQFIASFAERGPLDLVASHEPWAVQGLPEVGVVVHGHMHSPALEGNRIQAGTFTGGGPFTHFREQLPGEELTGQPYAFDVLAFGTDCRLASLTRFRYQNIIRGAPAYDDISLINGSRIDARPRVAPSEEGEEPTDESESAEIRECRAPTDIVERTVTAVAPDQAEGESASDDD